MTAQFTTPETSPIRETPDFCNFGMQQATEIGSVPIATLIGLRSYAIDLSKSLSLFSPIPIPNLPGDFLNMATKAYLSFMDLQMQWFSLLAPEAGNAANSGSRNAVQSQAEPPLDTGMDAAVKGTLEPDKS